MQADDLTHEESRKAVDLIIDRTADMNRRGLDVDILTVDNHCDGPYLYMRMLREGTPRADEVLQLLEWNGGNSSGIGIADIDNEGNVHADQFWWHHSFGNVRERPFSEIWTDTSDPLMAGLKDRKHAPHGPMRLVQVARYLQRQLPRPSGGRPRRHLGARPGVLPHRRRDRIEHGSTEFILGNQEGRKGRG